MFKRFCKNKPESFFKVTTKLIKKCVWFVTFHSYVYLVPKAICSAKTTCLIVSQKVLPQGNVLLSLAWSPDYQWYTKPDVDRHRRRINTEDKAKVVASVWGTEFIHCLAKLALLKNRINCTRMIWRRMHSSCSSNLPTAKQLACCTARNLINSVPQKATIFAFSSVFILLIASTAWNWIMCDDLAFSSVFILLLWAWFTIYRTCSFTEHLRNVVTEG